MLHISVSYRALAIVALLFAVAFTCADVAHGAPSAADLLVTDHIVFTGPGQNGARDIHTTGNVGGMRFYNGSSLTATPSGAAIQFFGNGHTGFPGQAFIDSGAHDNAAIILRTAPTSGSITERMRITAAGNVGIGTSNPQDQLHLTGNLRLPTTTATTGIIRSGTNTLMHTFGFENFFAGVGSGNLTMEGEKHTAIGFASLQSNTSGTDNTATGWSALKSTTTGGGNTATGASALTANTTGSGNTAVGEGALKSSETAFANTAIGQAALASTTAGGSNTAGGQNALALNTTGSTNTAFGFGALFENTTGGSNAAFGDNAGNANTTGSNNTFVGSGANVGADNLTNATAIGANAQVGASNSLVLGNSVSVGIGTSTPKSTLQVVGNYIQYPTISGAAPLSTDCDAANEAGRTVVRTDGSTNIYVCTGTGGWVGK